MQQDWIDPRGVHTMIAQSMYAYAVQRWLAAGFSLDQFLLVTQEDLAVDPAKLMRSVEMFLGVPHASYPDDFLFHRRNANKKQLHVSRSVWNRLVSFYRPHNAWLRRLFPYANLSSWDMLPE